MAARKERISSSLAQRLRLLLDARQHPVEGLGQQTGLVPADLLRAEGIIAALGNGLRHLRQREDRAGDPPLQGVGNGQRHQRPTRTRPASAIPP